MAGVSFGARAAAAPGEGRGAAGLGIRVEGLVKGYGTGRPAVEGLDLSVTPGMIHALLGPDGAGKTTALRCLAGVLPWEAGRVEVAGLDVAREPEAARQRLGYVPQRFSLYEDLTVVENLGFLAEVHELARAEAVRRIDELLAFVGLAEFRGRAAGHLSGGMKQKLALCGALLHRPQVLILDEPGTGVDPLSRREFWRILASLKEEGHAILLSTPYQDEAARSDRLGFLIGGRILAEGTPARVLGAVPGQVVRVETAAPFAVRDELGRLPGVAMAMVRGGAVVLAVAGDAAAAGAVADRARDVLAAREAEGTARVAEATLEDALVAYQVADRASGGGPAGGH